jgi:hypothetical protein
MSTKLVGGTPLPLSADFWKMEDLPKDIDRLSNPGKRVISDLVRTYRILYNHASRRKKLYLKTISKTHSLEECIKHARKVHFQ